MILSSQSPCIKNIQVKKTRGERTGLAAWLRIPATTLVNASHAIKQV